MFVHMGEQSETTVVGVRVTESRKSELEEYVEEHDEHDSVPALFRTAVAHELSDDYGRLADQQSGGSHEQLGELAATVSRLRTDIEDLTEEVTELSDEIRSDRPSEVVERMSAVHRVLPTDESDAMEHKEVAEQFEDMSDEQAWNTLMHLYEDGSVHRSSDGGWYTGTRE